MSFKKLRGIRLPEEKQGIVRFTCLDYAAQPARIRKKIDRLCEKCGGGYSRALFAVMTTRRSMTEIALEHHVSESALYRARKGFYEGWF